MHLMYFTEQPMSAYPAQEGLDFGATALMFSNKHFDPVAGSRLYNEYLEHYIYADELGIDGIMLNEHHNAPFCMQAKSNIFASILAAVTKKVKIVMLGNPLPLAENPVRLAEELSMIDMISKGRLVSGFVRGGGQEQLAAGVNPAFNRERFRGGARPDRRGLDARRARSAGRARITSTASSTRGRCRCRSRIRASGSPASSATRRSSGRRSTAIPISRSTRRSSAPSRSGRSTTSAAAEAGFTGRPRLSRAAEADPRRRDRGKGDRERAPVHVDAGRVHRPRPSGVEHAVGLRQPGQPPRLCRVRHRAGRKTRAAGRRSKSRSKS